MRQWSQYFNALIKISAHQICRTDEVQGLVFPLSVGKSKDSRMLEVATQNRAHPDVLTQTRDPSAQTTQSPDDQIDLDTFLTHGVQLMNHFGIGQ